ncbi:MAG TPA: hypothetical protein VJQ56_13010, partial [Blastocatellia bacterium]|nr:hypothetical protein [Blastocatellia bacterium]
TINPQPITAEERPSDMMRGLASREPIALPAEPASVTEGTTQLINNSEKVPAQLQTVKDTDSLP